MISMIFWLLVIFVVWPLAYNVGQMRVTPKRMLWLFLFWVGLVLVSAIGL